ncbi:hypothetical protein ACWD6U_00350 [Streptomyces sp. NPDC005149]
MQESKRLHVEQVLVAELEEHLDPGHLAQVTLVVEPAAGEAVRVVLSGVAQKDVAEQIVLLGRNWEGKRLSPPGVLLGVVDTDAVTAAGGR